MKRNTHYWTAAIAVIAAVAFQPAAHAVVLITNFNGFFENELYASWNEASATIVSGPTSYDVTAIGYGSNYTYIGNLAIIGAGNTHLELDVNLSGPPAADGLLGPIITLVDADNSRYNFAWYGQTLGDHLLTMNLSTPTWIGNPGTTPGLDLDNLIHMHMQLDPGAFETTDFYTVKWKNLNLITIANPTGDFDKDFDVDGADFLLWQRDPSVGTFDEWAANFGTPSVAPLAQAVPEPTTTGLLLLACAGILRKRRQLKTL